MLRTVLCLAAAVTAASPVVAHESKGGAANAVSLPASARSAAMVVDAFHAALRDGNTEAAQALLADDALIFEAGGVERSKKEYAAEHLAADAEFSAAVPAKLIRRSGYAAGQLAWVASEGRITGTFKSKPIDRVTTETMLLRRRGSGWKIVHIHWSSGAAR